MFFLLVFIQFITSFEFFCFLGVERSDQKSLHRKMPFVHDTKILLRWYQLMLPLIRFHLLIVLLQFKLVISALFWHRLWLPVTFYPFCHVIRWASKSQILLFCTITHAGLCKVLNNHGDLEVVLVEVHIIDRRHPRILLLIMKIQIV